MNRATRIVVTVMAVVFALSGILHGYYETLQGNTPTDGLMIAAVGEAFLHWEEGQEPALTIIPNFLITGLAAITVSVAIIIWAVGFLHTQHGATIMLLLFLISFFVGAGVAQIIFFPMLWGLAVNINRPLAWWRRRLPAGSRRVLARLWPWAITAGALLMLITLEISFFGLFPGVTDPQALLGLMGLCLLLALILFPLSFVGAIAADLQRADQQADSPIPVTA
ncbi:MAG: hypothetical protein GYB67_05440 [Chloroflexi bacterium]|nr:hypothetical protein [Chloroflexota bacterium]